MKINVILESALTKNGFLEDKLGILGSKGFQITMYIISFLLFLIIYIYFSKKGKMTRYKSKVIKITDDIYIPEPAGEGQYGTSHFLSKKDLDKKYKFNILNEDDEFIKKLLEKDEEEEKLINYYKEKGGVSKEDSENNNNKENAITITDEVKEEKEPYVRSKDPNILFEQGGIIANVDVLNNGKINKIHYISSDLHTIDIGATRSGKTRCFVLPTIGNQALAGQSIAVSDPKGELYQYTNKTMKKLGYEVICLDFKNPDKSSRYNLLQPIINAINENDIDRAINYTEELSNILAGEQKGEAIWHEGKKAVMTGAILSTIIANKNRPENQNLASVYRFINDSQAKFSEDDTTCLLAKYIRYLQDKDPTHPAIDNFAPIINAAEQTRLSFISGAMNTLRLYSMPSIWKITHKTDINITEMGERKQILYIILPDENTMYYPIASILVCQLYNELVKVADKYGGRLPVQVNFDLDEFGNFATIPDLTAKLTVAAGRGIRFNLILQDFAQMNKRYDKDTTTIIKNNCQTWIYLKSTDIDTLEALSKKLGTYTISSNSISTSSSKENDYIKSQSTSSNLCSRQLLQSAEIAKLKRPYTLVTDGEDHIIANTPDISNLVFNKLFNMGDEEHNKILRFVREKERPIIIEKDEQSYWRPFEEDKDLVNYLNQTNNFYQ